VNETQQRLEKTALDDAYQSGIRQLFSVLLDDWGDDRCLPAFGKGLQELRDAYDTARERMGIKATNGG